jgi:hypothetical protein
VQTTIIIKLDAGICVVRQGLYDFGILNAGSLIMLFLVRVYVNGEGLQLNVCMCVSTHT